MENKLEKIFLVILSISFFVGTWHAFPMLNVVGDEMYYVGGVLRAMENHTIIPFADDVPYGTLNYILSYIVSLFTILFSLPFFSFSLASLKLYLIQSPSIIYFTLRLTSAFLSVFFLFIFNKILKKEVDDFRVRIFLFVLLFTNIITVVILHTGKMWVLSTLLSIISFYYLYNVVKEDDSSGNLNKNIFKSIAFSFLALANFPLNIGALVSFPILLFLYRKDSVLLKKIIQYSLVSFTIYLVVTLFNFESIKNQIISIFVVYHPLVGETINNLSFLSSVYVYLIKLVLLFPLIIFTILFSIKNGIRNKKLFNLSLVYFTVYFLLIAGVANWTGDLRSSLRYLFPLGFYLLILLSSIEIKFNKIFYFVGVVSIYVGFFTIYLLSVPTTYNQIYDWVNKNLSSKEAIIINEVSDLQLVKNKQSSLYTLEKFCSSKCRNIITHNLNSHFKPLVIDPISKEYDFKNDKREVYYIKDAESKDPSLELVGKFINSSRVYHSVDYNIGSYFDMDYFRLKNLGKNQYIYKKNKK